MQNAAITKVDKSFVGHIYFSEHDVLTGHVDKVLRLHNLDRALKLGNLYKRKVKIIFQNSLSHVLETEATIWAVTENYIMLKGGKIIPIRSIMDVIV